MYLTYVETADAERREWEETKEEMEVDSVRQNFDLFGQLTYHC